MNWPYSKKLWTPMTTGPCIRTSTGRNGYNRSESPKMSRQITVLPAANALKCAPRKSPFPNGWKKQTSCFGHDSNLLKFRTLLSCLSLGLNSFLLKLRVRNFSNLFLIWRYCSLYPNVIWCFFAGPIFCRQFLFVGESAS